MIHDLSESHNLQKFGKMRYEKKHLKIKFIKYIINLFFKFYYKK